ncbi:hypothetical protein FA95DRAFT_1610107 [Auriscalpium vulgare]|uniref:Uncharacterized protein n=1 Tax=Auriscalpium vulgare TaxID=40419 RepID=A0ACB8RF71_9AGAM|nr:hypothetical protein FA95DRAFT_1610107 [Auriscalpium vulgare]
MHLRWPSSSGLHGSCPNPDECDEIPLSPYIHFNRFSSTSFQRRRHNGSRTVTVDCQFDCDDYQYACQAMQEPPPEGFKTKELHVEALDWSTARKYNYNFEDIRVKYAAPSGVRFKLPRNASVPSGAFKNLTTLRLTGWRTWINHPDLLLNLVLVPKLKTLSLHDTSSTSSDESAANYAFVWLNELETLDLKDTWRGMKLLLDHIKTPHNARRTLHARIPWDDPEDPSFQQFRKNICPTTTDTIESSAHGPFIHRTREPGCDAKLRDDGNEKFEISELEDSLPVLVSSTGSGSSSEDQAIELYWSGRLHIKFKAKSQRWMYRLAFWRRASNSICIQWRVTDGANQGGWSEVKVSGGWTEKST